MGLQQSGISHRYVYGRSYTSSSLMLINDNTSVLLHRLVHSQSQTDRLTV